MQARGEASGPPAALRHMTPTYHWPTTWLVKSVQKYEDNVTLMVLWFSILIGANFEPKTFPKNVSFLQWHSQMTTDLLQCIFRVTLGGERISYPCKFHLQDP